MREVFLKSNKQQKNKKNNNSVNPHVFSYDMMCLLLCWLVFACLEISCFIDSFGLFRGPGAPPIPGNLNNK